MDDNTIEFKPEQQVPPKDLRNILGMVHQNLNQMKDLAQAMVECSISPQLSQTANMALIDAQTRMMEGMFWFDTAAGEIHRSNTEGASNGEN